ncbi:hypothetical protein C8J56DRAFT_828828 [Mycena floridula]|nr:hypothetical protein C8J56DRAFT_828828 [Mycena floridula]
MATMNRCANSNCPNIFQPTSATKSQWTQLKSLLRGNCHPSRSIAEISQLLFGAENDLQRCNAEISRQQSYLLLLQNQRAMLQRHVEGYKSLASPFRQIPPEILRQIFQFVCTENRLDHDIAHIPGLILTHVSPHWRSVSMSTKSLWSTIVLETNHVENFARWPQAVRFLLDQSETDPLTLSIDIWQDKQEARNVLRQLAMQSRRWKEVTLGESTDIELLRPELVAIQGQLPILQSLTLPLTHEDDSIMDYFQVTPLLRSLACGALPHPDVAPLPWVQFQMLRLQYPLHLTKSLSLCPQLVDLHLAGPTTLDREDEMTRIPAVRLAQLQSFTMELNRDMGCELPFLSSLTLPSLRRLSISRDNSDLEVFPTAQISSLISRSGCQLTELSWSNMPMKFTDWITFLYSLPQLQTLTVADGGIRENPGEDIITDIFFDHLLGPTLTWASPVLPALQNLAIRGEAHQAHFSISKMTQTLQTRWIPGDDNALCDDVACLKSFKLDLSKSLLDVRPLGPLEQLVESGMKMVIRDRSGVLLC